MARKIFCDGCDDEIAIATVVTVAVEPPAGAQSQATEKYDLCSGCARSLKGHMPKAWPRAAHVSRAQ